MQIRAKNFDTVTVLHKMVNQLLRSFWKYDFFYTNDKDKPSVNTSRDLQIKNTQTSKAHLKGNLKRDPGNEIETEQGMRTQSVRK